MPKGKDSLHGSDNATKAAGKAASVVRASQAASARTTSNPELIASHFPDDVRSFKEFLAWAKISRTTAYDQMNKGLLCPIHCGKKLLFLHSECFAWLKRLSDQNK